VSSQRRNSLHTFDTGICDQFIRISQHLLINFHIFCNRLNLATVSSPLHTNTFCKERKPTETIPFPPEEKKEIGTDDMTPALSLTEFTSLTSKVLRPGNPHRPLKKFAKLAPEQPRRGFAEKLAPYF
jgi:hypothetical protein